MSPASVYLGQSHFQKLECVTTQQFQSADKSTLLVQSKCSSGDYAWMAAASKTHGVAPPLPAVDTRSVTEMLRMHCSNEDTEDAFFVSDLSAVVEQCALWRALLPRIEPHFAVKSNPDPLIVRLLANLGVGFDCASRSEIQLVLDTGVAPSRIIYANPCKQPSHLRYAAAHQVRMMTFDNQDEIYKMARFHPDAQAVLRIRVDDSQSTCQLGCKFGAEESTVPLLFETAKAAGVDVVGVSFHVGSGCNDAHAFVDAVERARRAFDIGREAGFDMRLLDVGGGFPGSDAWPVKFPEIAAVLRQSLDQHFPESENVRIISEPGRFFVERAFSLLVGVIARRRVDTENEHGLAQSKFRYYVNDGVYGSFNCTVFDHAICFPKRAVVDASVVYSEHQPAFEVHPTDASQYESSIFGPTCDGIDRINESVWMPEMNVGDWLCYERMGAYTICAASQFNGFKQSRILYTDTRGIAIKSLESGYVA